MKSVAKNAEMNESDTAAKIASFSVEIDNLKNGVGAIGKRVETFEIESRDSFSRLFDKLERATTPKETPWGIIFAAAGVLVAILTAIAGGGLTLILALAAWANAYFGEMIAKADGKAEQAVAIHQQSATTTASIRDMLSTISAARLSEEKEQDRFSSRLDTIEKRMEAQTLNAKTP